MDNDNSYLFSLLSCIKSTMRELADVITPENCLIVIQHGLMNHIPSLLIENFNQALLLLHRIYCNKEVPLDKLFLEKKTVFFFTEKVYEILKSFYLTSSKETRDNSIEEILEENSDGYSLERPIYSGMVCEYFENDLKYIIELFNFLIQKDQNGYLLNVLFDSGYFMLINCINTKEVWIFYDNIFYLKKVPESLRKNLNNGVKTEFISKKDTILESAIVNINKADIKAYKKTPLIEINRKQFDTEVLIRRKVMMVYKSFFSKYKDSGILHHQIAKDIVEYNLPMLDVSVKVFYHGCDSDEQSCIRPLHLLNYLEIGFLSRKRDLVSILGLLNLFKKIYSSENKIMNFKMVYKPKMLKDFDKKEFEDKGIELVCLVNELHKEIELDCAEIISTINEKRLRYIIKFLEYHECIKCTGKECTLNKTLSYKIIFLIKDVIRKNGDNNIFKISYLILLRSFKIVLTDHFCEHRDVLTHEIDQLLSKIVGNFKRNPYNFARMFFSYKQKSKKPDKKPSKKENMQIKRKKKALLSTAESNLDTLQDVMYSDYQNDANSSQSNSYQESEKEETLTENKQKLKKIIEQAKKSKKQKNIIQEKHNQGESDDYNFRIGLGDGSSSD